MKVEFTRPHQSGAMAGIGSDTQVIELDDNDKEGNPTAVPTGGVRVDDSTPAHDWQWERDAFSR